MNSTIKKIGSISQDISVSFRSDRSVSFVAMVEDLHWDSQTVLASMLNASRQLSNNEAERNLGLVFYNHVLNSMQYFYNIDEKQTVLNTYHASPTLSDLVCTYTGSIGKPIDLPCGSNHTGYHDVRKILDNNFYHIYNSNPSLYGEYMSTSFFPWVVLFIQR
jgi:hypothetical protein